jgi:hypothetical protein
MALVTRSSKAAFGPVSAGKAPQVAGKVAGEDIDAIAPCRIADDGLVYMTDATAANAAAGVDGFSARACKAGEPITLIGKGAIAKYADSGLTPGATYYAAATAGRLDTAATTGDAAGVAKAISATDIRVIRDY